jgi:hypothetical protein
MKYIFTILSISCSVFFFTETVNAARLQVLAPERVPATGEPFAVVVTLDTEGEVVSGVEGSLSFDENLFSIDSISIDSSVVSPWISFPHASLDRYFDNRTHIIFEGIFAGGFGGVKSAYYEGSREGKVFTVVLRPRSYGETTLVLDSLSLRGFNEKATEIPVSIIEKRIRVNAGTKFLKKENKNLQRVRGDSLSIMVAKSDLIDGGALHLVIDDKEPRSSVTEIYVAESSGYDGELIKSSEWHEATNPYILLFQNRSRYIHVKVIYSNDTYVIKTIEPVDNLQTYNRNSHILITIGMLIVAFCLYAYAKKYKIIHHRTT